MWVLMIRNCDSPTRGASSRDTELFASIRDGKPINNGLFMARSTMLAILGRMVTYTGKALAWDQAINSTEDLSPQSYAWDADPPILPDAAGHYPLAVPGVTQFV